MKMLTISASTRTATTHIFDKLTEKKEDPSASLPNNAVLETIRCASLVTTDIIMLNPASSVSSQNSFYVYTYENSIKEYISLYD